MLDLKLHRPVTGTPIHLDVSRLSSISQVAIANQTVIATETMTRDGVVLQQFDTVPDGKGITVTVTMTDASIQCGTVVVIDGACMTPQVGVAGEIVSGTLRFTAEFVTLHPLLVLHEVFRTMGITRNAVEGIMAANPSAMTAADIAMLRGRYDYPPNAIYSER